MDPDDGDRSSQALALSIFAKTKVRAIYGSGGGWEVALGFLRLLEKFELALYSSFLSQADPLPVKFT